MEIAGELVRWKDKKASLEKCIHMIELPSQKGHQRAITVKAREKTKSVYM